MKKYSLLLLTYFTFSAHAGLQSPFSSSIPKLSIPNSSYVGSTSIIRGQTPRDKAEYEELKNLNVKHVIIFKNQTRNEVDQEIGILTSHKIKFTHIDFPWKDIGDFKPECEKALLALKILKANLEKNSTTFFHCTVGEDRTGLLAGLILQTFQKNSNVKIIYQTEMCQKGYEAGDPQKLVSVAKTVRDNLNPVFLKFSYLLKNSNYQLEKINCGHNFEIDSAFSNSIFSRPSTFSCN